MFLLDTTQDEIHYIKQHFYPADYSSVPTTLSTNMPSDQRIYFTPSDPNESNSVHIPSLTSPITYDPPL